MSMDTHKGRDRRREFMVDRRNQRQRILVTRSTTHHPLDRRHLDTRDDMIVINLAKGLLGQMLWDDDFPLKVFLVTLILVPTSN